MGTTNSVRRLALAAALTTSLGACGGGGSPSSPTPASAPVSTPPPPVVVIQGGSSLQSGWTLRRNFTTTRAGAIDATVDWTFATNDVDVAIAKGDCTFDQLDANQCNLIAFAVSETAKPEKLNISATEAGLYTLFIENTGDKDESLSYQVILSPSATGAAGPQASSRVVQRNPLGHKRPAQGRIDLH